MSVDGQTITTGRGYSDTRSVRIEREDILYGCALEASTPLRVLLLSAPLTGRILETVPRNKVDTSGQTLLLLAKTMVTSQVRSRCISKTEELKHSYVMVKTFEHLLNHKLDAIVSECATMLQSASGAVAYGRVPLEMQQACLRCFVESLVHEHVMKSLAKLWADEVARFPACCEAIKVADVTLPPPPPASIVTQHVSALQSACCYTQKAELLQQLLEAILLSAGAAGGGGGGVISTDDLLPFIIAFVCAHACDGMLLLHVVFCDCLQHTLLAQGEWSFTLSLFKSAVVYVAASGSSAAAGLTTGLSKGVASRKNSVTSLAAALGSGSSSSFSVQQPQSVPPYRRSSLTRDVSNLSVTSSKIGVSGSATTTTTTGSSSSSSRPPVVISPDAEYHVTDASGRSGAGGRAVGAADRERLGSFLSSLIDDD